MGLQALLGKGFLISPRQLPGACPGFEQLCKNCQGFLRRLFLPTGAALALSYAVDRRIASQGLK